VTSDDPRPPPRRRFVAALGPNELKGLFWQVLVVGGAVAVIVFLWSNTVTNLSARRITTGFAFLGREAGMPIADSLLVYNPRDSYLWAFVAGIANTLRVAVIGIVLATILGTLIGISRLSANWLLSRLAAVYVEVLRDIPLLLQLLFWYVLMQALPTARAAWRPVGGVFLSNRGLILPAIPIGSPQVWVLGTAALGLAVFYVIQRWLVAQRMRDGKPRPAWPFALGFIVVLPAAVSLLLGVPWTIEWPELRGFNFIGGLTLSPEYFALLIARSCAAASSRCRAASGMPPVRLACVAASCCGRSSCRRRYASSCRR
jgi:general L-amino acid transport system permease protein